MTGFIALGLCIGLLIGVAQVVLKEAWLKVEAGFRKGRELLVNKPVLTIGRAESCDLGLFGDPQIEKLHARIYQQDGRYLIADTGSAHGTFVNDQRVAEPTLLRSGDLIRVGNAYCASANGGSRVSGHVNAELVGSFANTPWPRFQSFLPASVAV